MKMPSVPEPRSERKQQDSSTTEIGSVTVVSGEQFISPISGQRYRDVLPGQAAHVVSRDHRGIPEGFFERARQ